MATYRGLSVDGTNLLPVSSVSVSVARNLISEETMSAVGESKIFGGTYLSNGSIEAPYRTSIDDLVAKLFGGVVTGGVVDLPSSPCYSYIYLSDEYGNGVKVASCLITSMDLNVQTKDFAKVSFNWIGGQVVSNAQNFTTAPTYSDELGVFYNTIITVASASVQCTGVSVKVERPIDQDYYVLGSEFLQDFVQSGSVQVSGSITLAAKEWSTLNTVLNSNSTDTVTPSATNKDDVALGTIKISLHKPDGSTVFRTITIDACRISDASASVQGRNKFEKTVNWRAEINSSSNIKFGTS